MLNITVLIGRITAEPELRHTNGGIPVTSFTIAVERAYTKEGERITDFINIVAWRQTAEFVCKYFHKGQLIAVNGSLQVRDYVDRDNNKRKAYEVVADNVHFAEPKRENNPSVGYEPSAGEQASFANNTDGFEGYEDIGDDSLPF